MLRRSLVGPSLIAAAVVAVFYVGLFAHDRGADALAAGYVLDRSQSTTTLWQWLREALTAGLGAALLAYVARHKSGTSGGLTVTRFSIWAVPLFVLLAFRTVIVGYAPTVAAAGLRPLYFIAIILGLYHLRAEQARTVLRLVAVWIIPFLMIQWTLAFRQITTAPGVMGVTFLGTRPWGSYAHSNHLGDAALAMGLLFVASRIRGWKWLAVASAGLAFVTGTRAVLIGIAALALAASVSRSRYRFFGYATLPTVAAGVYLAASQPAISGRVISERGRLDLWRNALVQLETGSDWLLGVGVGVSSNAVRNLFGVEFGAARHVTDSMFVAILLWYGILGATIAVIWVSRIWRRTSLEGRLLMIPVGIVAVSQNLLEMSPLNLTATLLLGVLGERCTCRGSERTLDTFENPSGESGVLAGSTSR